MRIRTFGLTLSAPMSLTMMAVKTRQDEVSRREEDEEERKRTKSRPTNHIEGHDPCSLGCTPAVSSSQLPESH